MTTHFKHAVLGGTFDHFHIGHAHLIQSTCAASDRVTIGLVDTSLTGSKHLSSQIESYSSRQKSLKEFLTKSNLSTQAAIIPLFDIYGPSLTDHTIDVIFVTKATRPNARLINNKRRKLGLKALRIITVPFVRGDDQRIISSSRIRSGAITRTGQSFFRLFKSRPAYHLPSTLRSTLQVPLGPVIRNLHELNNFLPPGVTIISVGDIVTMDLLKNGYKPIVSFVDFKTNRRSISQDIIRQCFPVISSKISNQAGTINPSITAIFRTTFGKNGISHKPKIIQVMGEEDLLTLPSLLLSPLGAYVIYGLPSTGMCIVRVTEDIKLLAKDYLNQF